MRKLKNSEYTETVGGHKNNKPDKLVNFKNLLKGAAYVGAATVAGMLFAEIAYAKFDIDAGVAAATDPLIKAVKDHWGKAVMLTGAGAALFGEGDGRQRAIRAAIASGSAGGVILGLVALFT